MGDFALTDLKAISWFLLCSEHSETQLKTTIHCHLSWGSLPLTRPDGDEPSVKSIQEQLYQNKSYYSRQTENKWTSCEVTNKLSNEPWNGPVSHGLLRNHSPVDRQGLRQNTFLSYPWKSHRGITANGRQGKNPCYSNTWSQSTSAFVCYTPTRRGVIKITPWNYSLGTGLSGSSDSRTSWCRQQTSRPS